MKRLFVIAALAVLFGAGADASAAGSRWSVQASAGGSLVLDEFSASPMMAGFQPALQLVVGCRIVDGFDIRADYQGFTACRKGDVFPFSYVSADFVWNLRDAGKLSDRFVFSPYLHAGAAIGSPSSVFGCGAGFIIGSSLSDRIDLVADCKGIISGAAAIRGGGFMGSLTGTFGIVYHF